MGRRKIAPQARGESGAVPQDRLEEQALQILLDLGNRQYIVGSLVALAWHAWLQAKPEQAARLWAAASAARKQMNLPPYEDHDTYVRLIAEARTAANSPAAFDAAWSGGAALSLEEAARCALEHLDALS